MRARIYIARQWETETAMPSIFGGLGKGAQAAAFQRAMIAKTANLDNDVFAAALLDLVKASETVPQDVLVRAAHAKNYPLPLLRLCMAAYRLSRALASTASFPAR